MAGLDIKELLNHGLSDGVESKDAPTETAPSVPGYEILRLLDRGGMGRIFLARQLSLGRLVAIKVINLSGRKEILRSRLKREAHVMAKLTHPNLVAIHDYLELKDDHSAVIMEWVEGGNLRRYFFNEKSTDVPVAKVISVGIQVASCLQAAHAEGIVHRDIKPENLLIDGNGNFKVTDFGLALANHPDAFRMTDSSHSVGTIGYMAPEQLEGNPHVDGRADIFSLGVVLYELLTGRKPIGDFRAPVELRTECPSWLSDLIVSMLKADPGERIPSIELVHAILVKNTTRPGQRRRGWLVGGVFTSLGAALIGYQIIHQSASLGVAIPTGNLLEGSVSILHGKWAKTEDGGYVSGPGIQVLGLSRGSLKGKKTTVEMEFTRLSGRYAVAIFFDHPNGMSSVVVSAWNQQLGGVETISHKTLPEVPEAFSLRIENNRRYQLTATITDEWVEIRVDGKVMQRTQLGDKKLGISAPWEWDRVDPEDFTIAIGSFQSPTRFHSVVVEQD